MKKLILLLVVTSICTISCKKEENPESLIMGTWYGYILFKKGGAKHKTVFDHGKYLKYTRSKEDDPWELKLEGTYVMEYPNVYVDYFDSVWAYTQNPIKRESYEIIKLNKRRLEIKYKSDFISILYTYKR